MLSTCQKVNFYLKEVRQNMEELRQKTAKNQTEKKIQPISDRSENISKEVFSTGKT